MSLLQRVNGSLTVNKPSYSRRDWLAWGLFSCLIGVAYLYVYTIPYLLGQGNSLLLAVVMYGARAVGTIAIGLWMIRGLSLGATSAYQERQGRITAIVLGVLVGLQLTLLLTIYFDTVNYSVTQKVIYYLGLIVFLTDGILLVQHGRVREASILLFAGFVVEFLGSSAVAHPQRQAVIPFLHVCAVLIAGLLIRWWSGILVALIIAPTSTAAQALGIAPGNADWIMAGAYALYLVAIAGIIALYARSLESALLEREEAYNSIERVVTERTNQLLATQAELAAANAQLATYASEIEGVATTATAQLLRSATLANYQIQAATETLTSREIEILRLVGEELTNREIGDRLVIDPDTVRNHITTIKRKLQAASREDAAQRARNLRLI